MRANAPEDTGQITEPSTEKGVPEAKFTETVTVNTDDEDLGPSRKKARTPASAPSSDEKAAKVLKAAYDTFWRAVWQAKNDAVELASESEGLTMADDQNSDQRRFQKKLKRRPKRYLNGRQTSW